MKTVLIIYYSKSGHTQALAEGIARGVEANGAQAKVRKVEETTHKDLLEADAIIVGSPVYFGSMAAPIKELFDRSVSIRGRLKNKIGAAFVTSGHDTGGKETTILSIIQAMLIHEMIVVGDPISSGGHYGTAALGQPNEKAMRDAEAMGSRVADLVHLLAESNN